MTTTSTGKIENLTAKPVTPHVPHAAPATAKPVEKTFTELVNSSNRTDINGTQITGNNRPAGNYPQVNNLTDSPTGLMQLSSQVGGQVQQKTTHPTERHGNTSAVQKTQAGTGTSLLTAVKGFENPQQSGDDPTDLWGKKDIPVQYESEMSPAQMIQAKRQNSILAALFPGLYGDNDPFSTENARQTDKQIKQWQQKQNATPLVAPYIDELVAVEEQNKMKGILDEALKNNCKTRRNVFQTMACAKLYPRMKTLEPDWDVMFFSQMMPAGYEVQYGPEEDYGKFGPIEIRPELVAENNNEGEFAAMEAV